MPKPDPPPTPGSSSDLRGKEGAQRATVIKLPPNAFQEADKASPSSGTPSANGSDSSYRPVSPASPTDLSRKRPASQLGLETTGRDFALPPPPTRSRKIIQMKPRESAQFERPTPVAAHAPESASKSQTGTPSSGKKRQNNNHTTAAGRKIARKTAHSLIERRRRSKMNEEFGVLKDMIPACKGQEMHKLAILQASIDYLRYLEQCVTDLKAQNQSPRARAQLSSTTKPTTQETHEREEENEDEDEDDDEEMDDEGTNEAETAVSTPSTSTQDPTGSRISLPSLSQLTTTTSTSPLSFSTAAAAGAGTRHYSISSSLASYTNSPYITSNQTSPAFGPQLAPYSASRETFGLGSPALQAQDSHQFRSTERAADVVGKQSSGRSEQELDHEATEALLMLNNDRRSWRTAAAAAAAAVSKDGAKRNASGGGGGGGGGGAGMSVRDLLSG